MTNNLDEYLLYQLKRDFFIFYMERLKNKLSESKEYEQEDIDVIFGDVLLNEDFENYLEEFELSFSSAFDYEYLEEALDITKDFINEIEDLINIENAKKRLQIGYYYDYAQNTYLKVKTDKEIEEEKKLEEEGDEEEIVETGSISIAMKVIYLERLGIIELLKNKKPFNTSRNSMAKVLSRIIGAKVVSVQPLLNSILSKDTDSRHNPLNSEKNVEIVDDQLINIGFDLKKK
ncbi:hypothetical protein [Flavobacterium aquariorum]|uniref:hypothetical protein n=1 Tax=Flavobacterium aquariorum TaxID=2217670 RepID=UPI000F4E516A|nr:hypothetical protein [Flavobacterium aquariorum]